MSKIKNFSEPGSVLPKQTQVCAMLNRFGLEEAASIVGVSKSSLSEWAKAHGIYLRPMWVIEITDKEADDIAQAVARVKAKGEAK